jgi:hypothetical protein
VLLIRPWRHPLHPFQFIINLSFYYSYKFVRFAPVSTQQFYYSSLYNLKYCKRRKISNKYNLNTTKLSLRYKRLHQLQMDSSMKEINNMYNK